MKQLKDVIYCVNGIIEQPIHEDPTNLPPGRSLSSFRTTSTTTTTTNSNDQQQNNFSFIDSCFFIEGKFYIDEDELPSGITLTDLQNNIQLNQTIFRLRGHEWLRKLCHHHCDSQINSYYQPNQLSSSSSSSSSLLTLNTNSNDQLISTKFGWDPTTFSNQLNTLHASDPFQLNSPLDDPTQNPSLSNSLYEVFSMNKTLLSTLKFRLGMRYLFSHVKQICEHFLYFSDLRLYHTITDETKNKYPKLMYMTKFTRKKCDICLLWSGQYLVYGDRLTVTNPTLFCEHCYHMLHYKTNDELLYDDFVVFPYLHDMK